MSLPTCPLEVTTATRGRRSDIARSPGGCRASMSCVSKPLAARVVFKPSRPPHGIFEHLTSGGIEIVNDGHHLHPTLAPRPRPKTGSSTGVQ